MHPHSSSAVCLHSVPAREVGVQEAACTRGGSSVVVNTASTERLRGEDEEGGVGGEDDSSTHVLDTNCIL